MPQITNFENFMVCIIAVGRQPRNSRLPMQAKSALTNSEVVVIDAITPPLLNPKELSNLITTSSKLLGRRIGELEIAVMLSHRRCYEFFQQSSKKYLLVLEDDVEINNLHIDSVDVLNLLQSRRPIVISLYSPKWSVWKHTSLGLRAKIPPAYAAAYFMNIESTKLALSNDPLGLADWPPWAIKTRFYLRNYFSITTLENNSFLEKERVYDKKYKIKRILLGKSRNSISKNWQIRYIIVYPLIWKFYRLMRMVFRFKLNDKKIVSWI